MNHKNRSALEIIVSVTLLLMALQPGIGCGTGTTATSSSSDGTLGTATTLTGTIYAPNGTDPISGSTVYVPGNATTRGLISGSSKSTVTVNCGSNGGTITCTDPSETACASTCSCSDGSYTLDVSTCAESSTTIKFAKGDFVGTASLECSLTSSGAATCTVNITATTSAGSVANIAVVTGAFDEMENVLAKLGYGTVITDTSDSNVGKLQFGTESFSIYKCGGGRDSELATLDPDESDYKPCQQLFGSLTEMQQYDIIFVNCGADENTSELQSLVLGTTPEEAHALYHQSKLSKQVSTNVASRLSSFVSGGGTLYVTDLAYDYVEQAFPSFMDFEDGGDDDSSTAETEDAAEDGTSGIVSNATVTNTVMSSWLEGRSSNTINSSSSPNSGACDTTANGNSTSLLSAADDTIRVGDFLSGWAVMKGTYSGDSNTFVWLQGPVTFTGATDETRPLTASRRVGSGCVLYSSYHTSHSCPTTGFWPQERVLQYLVFETSGGCTP